MKKTAYIVISLILALVAFGCERENLSYPNQKKPDTKDSVPTTVPDTLPTPPENPDSTGNPNHPNDTSSTEDHSADSILLSQFAKRLSGQWKGGMETVYFDWRGVKEEHSGTADITFQLEKEGAHGGAGHRRRPVRSGAYRRQAHRGLARGGPSPRQRQPRTSPARARGEQRARCARKWTSCSWASLPGCGVPIRFTFCTWQTPLQ